MEKQPEALRLAEEYRDTMPNGVIDLWAEDVVKELRRLHAVNAGLLDALIILRGACAGAGWLTDPHHIAHMDDSRAAIKAAGGEV